MKLCRAQAGVWGNLHNIPLNFFPSIDDILAEAADRDARASVDVEIVNGLGWEVMKMAEDGEVEARGYPTLQ